MFKVRSTSFSGIYDCGDYQIRLADQSGGKTGKGNNVTSSLQVTQSLKTGELEVLTRRKFRKGKGKQNKTPMAIYRVINLIQRIIDLPKSLKRLARYHLLLFKRMEVHSRNPKKARFDL